MPDDRADLRPLVLELIARSSHSSVKWQTGAGDSYRATFPSGSIIIASRDNDGVEPYELELLNRDGQVVASARTIENYAAYSEDDEEWNNELRNLYSIGRSSALDIGKTITDILDDLRSGRQQTEDDDIPF